MSEKNDNKVPNVPNLRFSSFSDEWTTSLLKDSASFYKGTGISKEELSEEGHPCILYGELYTTYKTEKIEDVKSKTSLPTEKLVKSKANDVIIPASGETPIDIATACCIMNDDILLGGDLNIIRIKKHNGVFLSCQLNGKRKLDIAKIAQGASIVHLHNDDLKKLKCYYPKTLCEEEKIVAFLSKINERIDTQNKIIEDLKLYKNTIANQLIYNNPLLDKTVPLKEYATLKNGYAFKSDTYSESGNYKVVTIANVTGNKYISTTDCNSIETLPIDIQSHQILKFGDILISLTGNIGRVSIVNEVNCLLNQRVGVLFFTNIQLKKYLFQVLSNKLFETKMVQKGQGAAQKNIGNEDVESFLIPISNNLEYINKITKVLDALDEKIAHEKQILEKLKEQKKFLLSNMFI